MLIFIAGLILFFVPHTVSIVNEPWRNRMAERLGEPIWKGIYSIIAIVGLVLIIQGYGMARTDPTILYLPPLWANHLNWLLMLPIFPLLIATYAPGHIRALTRHPMLWATIIWAGGHLLANGMLADLLLFGTFFIWAVADLISMRRRIQRPLPELPATAANDIIAVVGGLGIYAAFLFGLHGWLIGVPLMG
ncbi:NnrU family protein [Thiohalomonas denitrificans]|uniref:Uncharacterized membrane protein n=1 Tax=Thiohalomonas denitrificans TaxID=415747 RepID=A0A1G5QKB6_9GAMM|nr:NnrU family protein [Thiohalomonas denitrificans]SCZ62295.1 Uncharacterized membrane protein [Thiohalomonas denitrificans]